MRLDQSFGIIPLCKEAGEWRVLLVKHRSGHWAFPKGHPNPSEGPKEAAERELQEETGLKIVDYLSQEQITEKYSFRHQGEVVVKTVGYFLAEVEGVVKIQEEEIVAALWHPLHLSVQHLTYKEGKAVCKQAIKVMQELNQ